MSFEFEPLDIDYNDLPESSGGSFEPLPAGRYQATVTECSHVPNKSGTGKYLKFRWVIDGPTHQGRTLPSYVTTKHQSEDVERIGRETLRRLMDAVGMSGVRLREPEQFVGKSCTLRVIVKDDPTYGPGNEVKGYFAGEHGHSAPVPSAPRDRTVPTAPARVAPPAFGRR